MLIPPTVGRVVWYYPDGSSEDAQPLAAVVTAVWGDRCVNLAIFEKNGVPMSHPPISVRLLQDEDTPPRRTDGALAQHCCWMPFQREQARRHAERELGEKGP